MKKFKPIIRCVIFLAGLAAIMGVIDFACVQTGYVNYILGIRSLIFFGKL